MTSYQLYARALALRCNIPAGEDIRTLSESRAGELELPGHDFWMFDARWVTTMHFDESGNFTGAEFITASDTVSQYREWARIAWQHSTSYETSPMGT
nr:DUF6879 family protein [Actinopolyspora mortivallis]